MNKRLRDGIVKIVGGVSGTSITILGLPDNVKWLGILFGIVSTIIGAFESFNLLPERKQAISPRTTDHPMPDQSVRVAQAIPSSQYSPSSREVVSEPMLSNVTLLILAYVVSLVIDSILFGLYPKESTLDTGAWQNWVFVGFGFIALVAYGNILMILYFDIEDGSRKIAPTLTNIFWIGLVVFILYSIFTSLTSEKERASAWLSGLNFLLGWALMADIFLLILLLIGLALFRGIPALFGKKS